MSLIVSRQTKDIRVVFTGSVTFALSDMHINLFQIYYNLSEMHINLLQIYYKQPHS